MEEKEFDELRKHLNDIEPIFNDFCEKHGFSFVPKKSIGRYPRVRIEQDRKIKIWFDLWMEYDSDGKRYTKFFPSIPYELSAGAFIDLEDNTKYGYRYQKSFVCFSNKPFFMLSEILSNELESNYEIVSNWSIDYLKVEGDKVKLG